MIKQNENLLDRLIRGLLASVFLVLGFFWFGGAWQIFFYFLGFIMAFTAISGFCALYLVFRINTKQSFSKSNKYVVWFFVFLIIIVLFVGSYASNFFSRKLFLEDFNAMNAYYKQTLFNTGQDKRQESIDNYDKLLVTYRSFDSKYSKFQPFVLRSDKEFIGDLDKIDKLIKSVDSGVRSGDLKNTHTELEAIRPIWQDIFKRNGFSMLAVALVDFHDSMEEVITPADAGDSQGVVVAYDDANQKLIVVEEEVNDIEIQFIRANLEKLVNMAENNANKDDLAKQAATLKASFVKVYLKRG